MVAELVPCATARDWFPYPSRAMDAPLRLFCLPFAGGGASRFRLLARLLAPRVAVEPVQFPGREARMEDLPYPDAVTLVADLSAAVESLADRPYALLGYSLGGSFGFELAYALTLAGAPAPVALFAVASPAPHTRPATRYSEMSDRELVAQMREWQAVPDEVVNDPEICSAVLATLRIDLGTWERHRHDPSTRLSCPIHVYAGASDPTVTPAQLSAWESRTTVPGQLRTFSGGHLFGFEQPDLLAAAILFDLGWQA
jgi:medium-chain acyl-[acyl-carrier-protein] hydrolase